MLPRPYAELLRQARRASRRADEAEDLLQTVLVAAVEATCEPADRQGLPHRFVDELPGGWSADIADPDGHTSSMYQSAEAPRSPRKVA